jgi:hypothetical protein
VEVEHEMVLSHGLTVVQLVTSNSSQIRKKKKTTHLDNEIIDLEEDTFDAPIEEYIHQNQSKMILRKRKR